MAALDYFERLGHDNHRRLCRVYGWEEKKTKGSWGGSTVDYKTIAGTAVREMNTREIQHFLVVCALASDLYCPRLQPSPVTGEGLELGAHGAVRNRKSVRVSPRGTLEIKKGKDPQEARADKNAAEVENKPASAGGLRQWGPARIFWAGCCCCYPASLCHGLRATIAATRHPLRHRQQKLPVGVAGFAQALCQFMKVHRLFA
jgi:hypothetical protein